MHEKKQCGKLILEDGSVFEGISFGSKQSVAGEVVFNTGMVGYPEALTDPSYKGQILVLTYPEIGNYGVPRSCKHQGVLWNFESEYIHVAGLIVANYSEHYSHHSAYCSLSEWLKQHGIPALSGIDTRALTQKLREQGTMLGKIVFDMDVALQDPNKTNLVQQVSVSKPLLYRTFKKPKWTVALIDCGVKHGIIRALLNRGMSVIRVPWNYPLATSKLHFDGVVISNGPGDPKMCKETIKEVRMLFDAEIPILGICLGNQLLALAAGGHTYKLKYGHRSQNQPCVELHTRRCYITSQNHGFAVNTKHLNSEWEEWFANANDGSNEGIIHCSGRYFSVQFHPEGQPGPEDTAWIFDKFLEVVKNAKKHT
jgi:carbamoyl-phosphate synthase small subunit